jgi:hypothetical protein
MLQVQAAHIEAPSTRSVVKFEAMRYSTDYGTPVSAAAAAVEVAVTRATGLVPLPMVLPKHASRGTAYS